MEEAGQVTFPRKRKKAVPLEHRHKAQSIIMSKSLDQLENEVALGFYENVSLHAGSRKRVFVLEVLYGLIWWTGFHGLTPFLAQPSLMDLPHSLSSLSIPTSFLFSPFLLSVGVIRNCVCSPSGLLLLRLTGLSLVAAHQLHSPVIRHVAINVGIASNVLVLCGCWWDMSHIDRYRKVYYFFLGFLLHLSVRVWLSTFSLAFMGTPLDKVFILLAGLIIVALYQVDYRTPVIHKKEVEQCVDLTPALRTEDSSYPYDWAWSGMGFGALLFVMQSLFGDPALIPRWVGLKMVTTGNLLETSTLLEHIGDIMIVAALSWGVLLSGDVYIGLLCSLPWLLLSILALIILTQLSYITALLGGLHLATYTSSLWFQLCQRLIDHPPYKAIFVSLLTYWTLISLAAIEGRAVGVSLLDCCLLFAVCLMGGSLRQWLGYVENAKKTCGSSKPTNNVSKERRRPSYILILGKVVRKLSTIIEAHPEEDNFSSEEDEEDSDDSGLTMHDLRLQRLLECEDSEIKGFDKKLRKALMVVFMATLIGSTYNYHPIMHSIRPSEQGEVSVLVGSWRMNAGYDLQGRPNVVRSVEIIREADPDVLCLFDVMRLFSGDFDSSLWISSELKMSAVRLPPNNQVVLVSRLPMVQSTIFTNDTTGIGVFAEIAVGSQSLNVFCLQNKLLRSGPTGHLPSLIEAAVSSGNSVVLVSVGSSAPVLKNHNLHLFSEVTQCDEESRLYFSKLSRENHTCLDNRNTSRRDMFLTRWSMKQGS